MGKTAAPDVFDELKDLDFEAEENVDTDPELPLPNLWAQHEPQPMLDWEKVATFNWAGMFCTWVIWAPLLGLGVGLGLWFLRLGLHMWVP